MYYCSVRVYGMIMRGTLGRLFTVAYFFVRSVRYRVLPSQLSCFSNVPMGRASGIIALGDMGREKLKYIFLASSQTVPAP